MSRPVPSRRDPVLWRDRHRLTMGDVDAAGIVFYANPYRWRDVVYTGWLLSIGHPLSQLLDSGFATPCVASSARYLAPIGLDDVVDLSLVAERVGTSSFDLRMDAAMAGQDPAVEVRTTNVWAARKPGGGLSAQPLPDWLVKNLSAAL